MEGVEELAWITKRSVRPKEDVGISRVDLEITDIPENQQIDLHLCIIRTISYQTFDQTHQR